MSLEIKRSPAKASWLLYFNGILLHSYETRREAVEGMEVYERLVGSAWKFRGADARHFS